jgi:hypothetical protein
MLGYIIIGYLIYRVVKAYRRSNTGARLVAADAAVVAHRNADERA